jgi:hypothetical protein
MAGSNLYPGPLGFCAHCDKKTLIRLGSLVDKPSLKKWVASEELIFAIYEHIRKIAKDGGGYVKTAEGKKYKSGKVVVCQRTKKCRKHAHEGLITKKLVWVAVQGKVGEMDESLSGPFCGICWPIYKTEFEHEDGAGFNFPLYYVITSFENIQLIFTNQPTPETLPSYEDPETHGGSGTDEVEGLF